MVFCSPIRAVNTMRRRKTSIRILCFRIFSREEDTRLMPLHTKVYIIVFVSNCKRHIYKLLGSTELFAPSTKRTWRKITRVRWSHGVMPGPQFFFSLCWWWYVCDCRHISFANLMEQLCARGIEVWVWSPEVVIATSLASKYFSQKTFD